MGRQKGKTKKKTKIKGEISLYVERHSTAAECMFTDQNRWRFHFEKKTV